MKKKKIIISLVVIGIISLFLKLYFIDFSTYIVSDATSYALNSFSYLNNDFTPIHNKSPGWPILISIFSQFIDSESFIDYGNMIKILSISISTITILPVYLLARKWFPEKYSLVAASFFAFEPHLNNNAGIGYTEPLYIIFWVIAFYFISSDKYKFVLIAFVIAALAWWVRWPGAILFVILSVIYFVNFRKIKNGYLKYLGCLGIFIALILPMLLQRYEEFGNPLYYGIGSQFFVGEYPLLQSDIINKSAEVYSLFDSIKNIGFLNFLNKFIVSGIINLFTELAKISFPYLILLIPFGILFSFRAFDQDKKLIRSNWILLIISFCSLILTFSVVPEKRYLLTFIPFLILFSIIPIQRVVTYGLSTFSFSEKQKNVCLIMIICIALVSSIVFMQRYDTSNELELEEKTKFADYMLNNFEGTIIDGGNTLQGLRYLKLVDPPGSFKMYQNSNHNNPQQTMLKEGYLVPFASTDKLISVSMYAKTLDEFMMIAKEYEIDYISIREEGPEQVFYPYFDKIYTNESQYHFFEKVFDSDERGYKEFKVKVFKINLMD